jgi:LPXTG-motif cell wall-anchored protein
MLGDFEILEVVAAGDSTSQSPILYELLIVAYDTGSFSLPVSFPEAAANAQTVSIRVTAPPEESIKNYAPPKELVFPTSDESSPMKWPLLIAGLMALLALAYWLLKRKKKTVNTPTLSANGVALLQQVKNQWLGGKLDSLQLGEGLVNSLQAQLGVTAKKSTRQFFKAIRNTNPKLLTTDLQTTLQYCDAWRFGKQIAQPTEGNLAIAQLEQLFNDLKPIFNPAS